MNLDNPKIVFMGTPDFAVPTLEAVNKKYGVISVVTLPDRKKGRGRKLLQSAVKSKAKELNIPILQPDSLLDDDFERELEKMAPDIIIVIAFRILPEKIYSLAKIGTFNIHGSLLPKYRGAAPINHAIINGEAETGLTSFLLDSKVDTGKILMQTVEPILPEDTAGDLHDRLMMISPELTLKTIDLILTENYQPVIQNESEATSAPKLFRDKLKINFNNSALDVKNFIHGTSPIPCSWTIFNGNRLKIYRAGIYNKSLKPGEYQVDDNKFIIGCSDISIEILELQTEGKKMTQASEFIKGYRGDSTGNTE